MTIVYLTSTLVTLCVCLSAGMSGPVVGSSVGSSCSLRCTAEHKPAVQYLSVRWYKVGVPPASHLDGLLTRELPNGTTRWFVGVGREVELLGESLDIFLTNLTCSDSGMYLCHLAAPVGEENQEGRVLLTLTGCPDRLPEELLTDSYLVILASVVLMAALCVFLISYVISKKLLRDRNRTIKKEMIFLDAPLQPLEDNDFILISMLGPKSPKKF